jgi:hypothetical protein
MIDLAWVQDVNYALLMSAPILAPVNIVKERTLIAKQEIELDAIWQTVRNNRSGNGVLIEEVEARINSASVGAQDLICKFVCFQNGDAAFTPESGSGFFALNLAQTILDLLNRQAIGNLGTLQGVGVEKAADYEYINAARVTLKIVGAANLLTPRCAQIAFTNNAGTVTLSCSTPGATIYYTTDGSVPCDPALMETISQEVINPNARIYTAPFAVASGDVVTAVAQAAAYNASAILNQTIA